jgi:hypothetical protein
MTRIYEAHFGHKLGTISFEVEAGSVHHASIAALDVLVTLVRNPNEWQLNAITHERD